MPTCRRTRDSTGGCPVSKARSARPATPSTSAATPTSSSSAARRSIMRTRISHWRARTPRPHAANATSRARNTAPQPAAASTAIAATMPHARQVRQGLRILPRGLRLGESPVRPRQDEVRAARPARGDSLRVLPRGQSLRRHADAVRLVPRAGRRTSRQPRHGLRQLPQHGGLERHEVRPPERDALRAHGSTCEPQLSGLPQDREPEGPAAEGLPRLSPGRRCACHTLRHCMRAVPLDRRLEAGGFRPCARREIRTRRRARQARLPHLPHGAGGDAKARQ